MVIIQPSEDRRWMERNKRIWRRRVVAVSTGLVALWLWGELKGNFVREVTPSPSAQGQRVENFVRLHCPEFMRGTSAHYGTIFVIDAADFGCPPCFEHFEKLLGELMLLVGPESDTRLLMLLRQEAEGPWSDSSKVRRWADIQGFAVPILMVADSVYRSFGLRKTNVLVVDRSLRRVIVEEIPMESEARSRLSSRMGESDRVENP